MGIIRKTTEKGLDRALEALHNQMVEPPGFAVKKIALLPAFVGTVVVTKAYTKVMDQVDGINAALDSIRDGIFNDEEDL